MQLNSGLLAGLGSGSLPPPEMMKALQYNPLLYYSYYAQMLSALQAQQKLIELNSSVGGAATPPPASNNNNNFNNNNPSREKLSPLKMPSSLSALKDNNQVSVGRPGDVKSDVGIFSNFANRLLGSHTASPVSSQSDNNVCWLSNPPLLQFTLYLLILNLNFKYQSVNRLPASRDEMKQNCKIFCRPNSKY